MNVNNLGRARPYRTVAFDAAHNAVLLIEQRLLPHHFKIVSARDFRETARAISDMIVRGAGAIGATAAYGLAQGARAWPGRDLGQPGSGFHPVPGRDSPHRVPDPIHSGDASHPGRDVGRPGSGFHRVPESSPHRVPERPRDMAAFQRHVETVYQTLKAARPTAVDPVNAMDQVRAAMRPGETVEEQQALALAAAEEFANEDVRHCQAIGRHGVKLIRNGMNILTHCNAGWLAFVDVGSATAPLYAAQARGKRFHVFCDETRPRSQGATLTAWELAQQGISHQIIADNAAGHLMQRGKIDLVIVGSDRTLGRTGEVANKIGTYTKAVLAHRHGIPFYVAIPLSSIDWRLKSGFDIPIEERHPSEVLGAWGIPDNPTFKVQSSKFKAQGSKLAEPSRLTRHASHPPLNFQPSTFNLQPSYFRTANPSSSALNPGFDVTPPELITGIITPVGIFKPRDLWSRRRALGWTP